MTDSFVHLGLHTEYSLADSVVRVNPLMKAVADGGMPAVALTDQNNLFAMVKFYRAAIRNGIKPIIGVDAWLEEPDDLLRPSRLVLLCMNSEGYRCLSRLVTRSYLEGQHRGVPMISREWLTPDACRGLIALSGGTGGDLGRALVQGHPGAAEARLAEWRKRFPDRYYIEVCRTGRPDDEQHVESAVSLAARHGIPIVATNDVRFLTPQDYGAHEARVCIHDGHTLTDPGRPRRYTEQQYLRSPAEMAELFADLPEALVNSVEIARRCNLNLKLGESVLPEFPVPEGQTTEAFLYQESVIGLLDRLGLDSADQIEPEYRQRLDREVSVICEMGFPGYFLIVADFISWSRKNRIPVGPGRGSGAGSLVAYSLKITDLDPIEHKLLFERFLNPERVSMPDFDIDFCMEGRDRVIDYVAERYGRDQVSQIITYGTMAAKAVVRDVGRVLGHPYGFVDRIAKLIPFEIGMTLDKALHQEDELQSLYQSDDDIRALIDLARRLEGLVRNAGKHAGGVVIAPKALTEYAPLYCEDGGRNVVTQFDKDDVEACGLVKFDFLGLRTLTIIDWAVGIINKQRLESGDAPLEMDSLPFDDPATYELLKRCQTTAVFQLESRGMKDLIKRLQPDHFDEIVALVALFRPGPLQSGMVDNFISRKHAGRGAAVDYLHPELKPVLQETYGVILYQEQVMQIAQVLAGYSLGEADLLRRAMGKKKASEMAKQREIFVSGAEARGVPSEQATHIFDLMEKFAGYGFNKSHSAAYAVLSYRTAWLKCHHPAAFMAAVLSADMDNTDKVVTLIDECDAIGVTVEVPDINRSEFAFAVSGEKKIRYGLGAIKGVGRNAIEGLIAERQSHGNFLSLTDLCQRIDPQKINRRVLEALVRSGAMDSLPGNRATLMARLPEAVQQAEQDARAAAAGQNDMFGFVSAAAKSTATRDDSPALPDWSDQERLAGERETLGLYLTGHPINQYARDLPGLAGNRIADLRESKATNGGGEYSASRSVRVAGLVCELRKRGNRLTLVLDDRSGRIEVTVFEDLAQRSRHLLRKDAILVVQGTLRFDEFINDWRITAREIEDIDDARERNAKKLIIEWEGASDAGAFVDQLRGVLARHRNGQCGVWVRYKGAGASAMLTLGKDWEISPSKELIDRLGSLVGNDHLRLVYPPPLEH